MKWTKRITALVLCFFLVSSGTISAFEEAGFFDNVDATLEESQAKTIEGCAECGLLDGHAETCSQYVSPEPEGCAECGLLEGHAETCSQYVSPEPEGCAECGLLEGHTEDCSLYVRQETQPEDEISWIPSCDCDYAGESGLSGHTDSCARKSFVRNELIKNYSTEELYAMWDGLESEIQEAVLTFLSWDDYSKYTELKDLLDNGPAQGGEEEEEEELVFSSDDVDGVSLGIFAPEGRFPSGTTVEITPVEHSRSEERDMENTLETFLGDDYTVENLGVKMMDITFTHEGEVIQPEGAVYVTFELDEDEIDEDANTLTVFHFDDDGDAEIVANQRIDDLDDVSVTVEAYSFSHYAVMTSQTKYKATLLKDYDDFKNQDRYSIVEFPVTLNDFDAQAYNNAYGSGGLWFTIGDVSSAGRNGGSMAATQGLVEEQLSAAGYPITDGQDRGEIIFGTGSAVGKTSYSNVDFEFVYDAQDGYYTYNSGANHAQLDRSNPNDLKVKLYADTMAPFNYFEETITKTDSTTINITANIYGEGNEYAVRVDGGQKFRIKKKSSTQYMFRYLLKENLDAKISTDKYKNFCIRLKSSHEGRIIAQVKFGSGTVSYELNLQKDTWADYVFGDFPAGTTVKTIVFLLPDAEKDDIIEYGTAGFMKRSGKYDVATAGLYPFTDITSSYAGGGEKGEGFNIPAWQTCIEGESSAGFMATRVWKNSTLKGPYLSDAYAYYAMSMEVDFYIPLDGQSNGNDIVFHFDGDDDMWVFVDDQLALDIGGLHTAVKGNINFTDGTTYVSNRRSSTENAAQGEKEDVLQPDQYKRGEYHTLKIFYMERAGTNSNCLIKFNLTIMPTGNVIVDKTVVEDGCDVPDDLTFTFRAEVENSQGQLVPHANKAFTLATRDSNGNIIEQTPQATDANGQFTLKHNQVASFGGIDEGTEVTITEIEPTYNGEAYICTSTTANGEKLYSATQTTSASAVQSFRFVNTYDTALTEIVVQKTLTGMPAALATVENQTFLFHVKGTDTYTKDVDLTVAINISPVDRNWKDSVTIKDVPVGTYTVTEITDWSWRYEPKTGDGITDTKTVKRDKSNNTFSFTNDRADPYWLSGDCYCENWWNGSSVTEKEKRKDVWPSNN